MNELINIIFIGIAIYAILAALAFLTATAVIRIIHKAKRKGAIYV